MSDDNEELEDSEDGDVEETLDELLDVVVELEELFDEELKLDELVELFDDELTLDEVEEDSDESDDVDESVELSDECEDSDESLSLEEELSPPHSVQNHSMTTE